MRGAGNLLMVYHAEIPTIQTQSFDSVFALAASIDQGMSWTDLGEIVRINQGYRTDMDGFDIGDAPLVVSPDGKYFYIYFRDWLANGNTITLVSVARAPVAAVLEAAFLAASHMPSHSRNITTAGVWIRASEAIPRISIPMRNTAVNFRSRTTPTCSATR
jgi:hypothetical protein